MFASREYHGQAVSGSGRKRTRERDENDAGGLATGFGEHRSKRLHSLPLRTSPLSSQQRTAVTPEHVSHVDLTSANTRFNNASSWSSAQKDVCQLQNTIAELDMMDVTDSGRESPHRATTTHDVLGRMPTPMQPSFAAQVRGQHCEWAGPGPAVKSLNGIVNLGHHQTGFSDDQCVSRIMPGDAEWHTIQNNRRLPSPISEMSDSSKHHANMMVDERPSPMPLETMDQDMECQLHPRKPFELEPALPSPGRRGHTRSKHTVNSWTWQPGMKKSFSIGYRPDCEKCRLNVPGHFNHIIIS